MYQMRMSSPNASKRFVTVGTSQQRVTSQEEEESAIKETKPPKKKAGAEDDKKANGKGRAKGTGCNSRNRVFQLLQLC